MLSVNKTQCTFLKKYQTMTLLYIPSHNQVNRWPKNSDVYLPFLWRKSSSLTQLFTTYRAPNQKRSQGYISLTDDHN